MKTLITLLALVFLASCASNKTIDKVKYEPYGLFNEETVKADSINYEVSAGSVICSIIFCETIVIPVYTVGWDLFQPVSKKQKKTKGSDT